MYRAIDVAPDVSTNGNGLYGANRCTKDQDFHSTICRVTDYATSGNGTSFNMGSSGEPNEWALDSSAFLVNTRGRSIIVRLLQ